MKTWTAFFSLFALNCLLELRFVTGQIVKLIVVVNDEIQCILVINFYYFPRGNYRPILRSKYYSEWNFCKHE